MAAAGDQGDVRLLAAGAAAPRTFSAYPGLFGAADAAAVAAQRQHFFAEGVQIALNPVAAALALLAALGLLPLPNAVLTAVTTTLLVIMLWVARAARWEKLWYECRTAAEEVKGLAWRYMMQLDPFPPAMGSAEVALVRAVDDVLRQRPDIRAAIGRHAPTMTPPLTAEMQRVRRLPPAERALLYVEARLRPEQRWYAAKARRSAVWDRAWFVIVSLVQLTAVAAAIWVAVRFAAGPTPPRATQNLVPALTALGGASMGWARSKRYSDRCMTYASAAHTLAGFEATEPPADAEAHRAWMATIEAALAREHEMWRT